MNKCCGRANGDSANDLIINIKAISIVNCAVKVLRKHYLLHYSLCLLLFFSLILHCEFSLYLLP